MEQKKMTKQELFLWSAFAFAAISAVSQTVWVLRLGLPMSMMGRLFMNYVLPYLLPAAAHFIAGGKYRRWAYAGAAFLLLWASVNQFSALLPHGFLNMCACIAEIILVVAVILWSVGLLKNMKTMHVLLMVSAGFCLVYCVWVMSRGVSLVSLRTVFWNLANKMPFFLWALSEKEEFLTPVIKQSAPAPKAVQPAMNMEVNTMDVNATNGVAMKFCSHCGKEIMAAAVVCPHCGCAVGNVPMAQSNEAASGGEKVIAFLLPIVGLILYLVNNDKAPVKAKEIGKWALIGFLVGIGCSVLLGIIGGAATASLYY